MRRLRGSWFRLDSRRWVCSLNKLVCYECEFDKRHTVEICQKAIMSCLAVPVFTMHSEKISRYSGWMDKVNLKFLLFFFGRPSRKLV